MPKAIERADGLARILDCSQIKVTRQANFGRSASLRVQSKLLYSPVTNLSHI